MFMAEVTREKTPFMLWRLTHNIQGFDRDLLNIDLKVNKSINSEMGRILSRKQV